MFGKKAVTFQNYLGSRLFYISNDKLVVIIYCLKVTKIKKILLYEKKFLVPNYSCLQNPWLGGYAPRSPFSLFSVLNWICWTPPPKKNPGYATDFLCRTSSFPSLWHSSGDFARLLLTVWIILWCNRARTGFWKPNADRGARCTLWKVANRQEDLAFQTPQFQKVSVCYKFAIHLNVSRAKDW